MMSRPKSVLLAASGDEEPHPPGPNERNGGLNDDAGMTIVNWYGTNNSENPMNWLAGRKIWVILLITAVLGGTEEKKEKK